MKQARLIHNPEAGDEAHSKKNLLSSIQAKDISCRYSSTKQKGWKKFGSSIDMLMVAGGDGTVRKVAKQLLKRTVLQPSWPVALLPLGTANNIAKALHIKGPEQMLEALSNGTIVKPMDVCKLSGVHGANFFMESFGAGLFPEVMKKMSQSKKTAGTPEQEIQRALEVLHETAATCPVEHYEINLDGKDHSGEYFMVELMNIRSLGPNLVLAPEADPGDGQIDVVLLGEKDRKILLDHLKEKSAGREHTLKLPAIKAAKVKMKVKDVRLHADDQPVIADGTIKITVREKALRFLAPSEKPN